MNTWRGFRTRLGIGAFGIVFVAVVATIFWGLLAVDGLLARTAEDQRAAAADYVQALAQRSIDTDRGGNAANFRTVVAAALTDALVAVRRVGASAAVVVAVGDTVFAQPRTGFGTDHPRITTRAIRLPDGRSVPLLIATDTSVRLVRTTLWIVGVLGILLLGVGVARERYQSLQVAGRSADVERLSTEALRANAMKSEFLANVSHELRTPLTAIVGFVEMLRDGVYGELAPRQIGPVDRIAASATHLRHLVDQILDIARITAGRLELSREVMSLRPFVLTIASELESLFSERSLKLSISVPVTLPRVRTDPTHLRHILVNLMGNAVKYTPSGGVSVRARLLSSSQTLSRPTPLDPTLASRAPSQGTPWIALQVIDTGIGVAARDRERIFDEFEQVNAGPRTDSVERGTGLGLAISRRLARSLGGDITVDSEPGKGSTFTMWLPVDLADLAAAEARAAGASAVEGQSTSERST